MTATARWAHPEMHGQKGSFVRDMVLGSSDGLVAVLAFVAGVSASIAQNRLIVIAGLAEMFAGATSMGLGAFLASKSYREYYEHEIRREKREIVEMPEAEREEIRHIYREKGFRGEELEMIVRTLTENKERWLQTMMREELGFTAAVFDNPFLGGLVVFLAYIIGAAVPIFPYAMLPLGHALALSVGLTLVTLFAIGAAKAQMSHKKWLKSGLEMMVTGGLGALLCYFIGKLVAHVAG